MEKMDVDRGKDGEKLAYRCPKRRVSREGARKEREGETKEERQWMVGVDWSLVIECAEVYDFVDLSPRRERAAANLN